MDGSPAEAGGEPATLAGLPVLAGRLEDADPIARRAIEYAQALLADRRPDPPPDASMAEMEPWLTAEYAPWLERVGEAFARLDADLERLEAGGVRDRTLASIVEASVADALAAQMSSLPPPTEIANDAELRAVFDTTLAERAAPLARRAREAYRRCESLAPSAPAPLPAWRQRCATGLAALGPGPDGHAEAAAARGPEAPAGFPPVCVVGAEPDVPRIPAPDDARPLEIALLGPPDELASTDPHVGTTEGPLLAAVARRLRRLRVGRVLSFEAVGRAVAEVDAHRWTAGGPRCSRPPELERVLARDHANVVVGRVVRECDAEGGGERRDGEPCRLRVSFRRGPVASGRFDVPPALEAEVPGARASQPEAWVTAAAHLARPPRRFGVLGAMRPGLDERPLRVASTTPDAWPWTEIVVWEQRDALAACAREDGVVSVRLGWAFTAAGAVSDAHATPLTVPAGADADALARCVEDAVARGRAPCTPSGAPERAEVTLCLAPALANDGG